MRDLASQAKYADAAYPSKQTSLKVVDEEEIKTFADFS